MVATPLSPLSVQGWRGSESKQQVQMAQRVLGGSGGLEKMLGDPINNQKITATLSHSNLIKGLCRESWETSVRDLSE